jgi:uncharacterized repeat protein (TIGR02543 family)
VVADGHGSASLNNVAMNAGTGLTVGLFTPYKVEFDTGTADVTAPVSQFVFPGGKATAPSGVSRTGYSFDGWWTTNNYTNDTQWVFATNTVSESVTLFAKWVEKSAYTVTYDLNYPDAPDIGSKQNVLWTGTGLLPAENPKRVGYTFSKWTIDSGASSTTVTATTAYSVLAAGNDETESVTIYAQWVVKSSYVVSYDLNYEDAPTVDSKTGVSWTWYWFVA